MKEKILALLGSEAAVAEQFFDTLRRSEHLEPEKALLLAILQDAIDSFQKYSSAHDRLGKQRFHEAEEWIMESGDDWIFSFNNVCELLGLDPEYVQRGLQKWKEKAADQEKRQRHSGARRQAA